MRAAIRTQLIAPNIWTAGLYRASAGDSSVECRPSGKLNVKGLISTVV